jgi:hypothetical protein
MNDEDDSWSVRDINQMSMEEYRKYREHILDQVKYMTVEEVREAETIPKPRPKFQFKGF